jgi:hypothetical protein
LSIPKERKIKKMLANNDIRTIAKEKGVRLWEVAEVLKVSDPTMTRKLRRELPQDEKDRIFKIIDELAAEKAAKK